MQSLAFYSPSFWEILLIVLVGLLLFGRRLPEVARGLGRSVVEFKKGLKGIEDDAEQASEPRKIEARPDERDRVPATPAASSDAARKPEPPAA